MLQAHIGYYTQPHFRPRGRYILNSQASPALSGLRLINLHCYNAEQSQAINRHLVATVGGSWACWSEASEAFETFVGESKTAHRGALCVPLLARSLLAAMLVLCWAKIFIGALHLQPPIDGCSAQTFRLERQRQGERFTLSNSERMEEECVLECTADSRNTATGRLMVTRGQRPSDTHAFYYVEPGETKLVARAGARIFIGKVTVLSGPRSEWHDCRVAENRTGYHGGP